VQGTGRFACLDLGSGVEVSLQVENPGVMTLRVSTRSSGKGARMTTLAWIPIEAWRWLLSESERPATGDPLDDMVAKAFADSAGRVENPETARPMDPIRKSDVPCCLYFGAGAFHCSRHGSIETEIQVFSDPNTYICHCPECHKDNWRDLQSYSGALPVFSYLGRVKASA